LYLKVLRPNKAPTIALRNLSEKGWDRIRTKGCLWTTKLMNPCAFHHCVYYSIMKVIHRNSFLLQISFCLIPTKQNNFQEVFVLLLYLFFTLRVLTAFLTFSLSLIYSFFSVMCVWDQILMIVSERRIKINKECALQSICCYMIWKKIMANRESEREDKKVSNRCSKW
jgi:hypothetical protein